MSETKKVRILSLDGGGIRGVIPAIIVKYIEEQIIEKSGNPDARIANYFDMIVGTSTGGMLTCFYLKPNPEPNGPLTQYKAEEALDLYVNEGYDIFNASKYFSWFGARQLWNATQYSPKYLEQTLKSKFKEKGEDGKEVDMMLDKMVLPCTVTTYNMNEKSSRFLRSTDKTRDDGPRTYKVWEALRSTSAAPTYFPPAVIHNYSKPLTEENKLYNLDGGVFANNPTICAYSEARNMNFIERGIENPTASEMQILSIGTGGGNFDLKPLKKSGSWCIIKWAKSTPNIMMDGSIDTTHYQMKQIFGTLKEKHHSSYLRVDVLPCDRKYAADMADASEKNINDLKVAGEKTLKQFKVQLDKFIEALMDDEVNP